MNSYQQLNTITVLPNPRPSDTKKLPCIKSNIIARTFILYRINSFQRKNRFTRNLYHY